VYTLGSDTSHSQSAYVLNFSHLRIQLVQPLISTFLQLTHLSGRAGPRKAKNYAVPSPETADYVTFFFPD